MADIHKISKSRKLLVKMKNVPFILWKNLDGLFGQSNIMLILYVLPIPVDTYLGLPSLPQATNSNLITPNILVNISRVDSCLKYANLMPSYSSFSSVRKTS